MSFAFALAVLLAGGSPAGVGPAEKAGRGVHWERDFQEAMRKARTTGKPVMIDFWAEWCGWCHRLDQTTYLDPVVVKLSREFVAVKVDTEGGPREQAIALRYDVSSLPTITFVSPAGNQLVRLNGFQGPGQFPRTMEFAREVAVRVTGLEKALEKNPADPAALSGLGTHLFEQEFYESSRESLKKAVKLDGERPAEERKRNRLLLAIIQKYDKKYTEAEWLLKDGLSVKPPSEDDAKLMFVLGKTYLSWGRREESEKVFREIIRKYPQSPMMEKAREMLGGRERRP